MKKFIRLISLILLALCTVTLCSCVGWCGRTKEDVIPSKFGAPEGLWLYSGNQRSYTDGSGKQPLLQEVEIDGIVYDEFTVKTYTYVNATCEIFFVIQIDENYHICHYNYKTKQSGSLYALQSYGRGIFAVSGNYVFLNTDTDGVLFTVDAQLVDDCFLGYTLDNGVLYYDEENNNGKFTWFTDGEFKSIDRSVIEWQCKYWVYGDYIYVNQDAYGRIKAINIKTADVTVLPPLMEENCSTMFKYYADGVLYIVAVKHVDYNYYLYKITGAELKLVKDLGEAAYGMEVSLYEGNIYFKKTEAQDRYFKYKFNVATEEYGRVYSIPAAKISDYKEIIGDYTFYVDYTTYMGYDDAWGFPMEAKCYYLYRKSNNRTEIMQYSFNSSRFYDALCEF